MEIKVQIEIGKSKLVEKKKSFLRPRCKIAVNKYGIDLNHWEGKIETESAYF